MTQETINALLDRLGSDSIDPAHEFETTISLPNAAAGCRTISACDKKVGLEAGRTMLLCYIMGWLHCVQAERDRLMKEYTLVEVRPITATVNQPQSEEWNRPVKSYEDLLDHAHIQE